MKRKSIMILIIAFLVLASGTASFYNRTNKSKEASEVPVSNGELICSSTEGYNSIEVYKQKEQLVINAKSEAAFFDGAQFTVETSEEIKPEDVEIIWMTINGRTEQTEDNDRIIAEIKIVDGDELICDKKINFAKKAFDAIEDVLEQTTKESYFAGQ